MLSFKWFNIDIFAEKITGQQGILNSSIVVSIKGNTFFRY